MKNLLKSVMLVLLIVPNIGCESESIDTLNSDQSRISLENSLTTNAELCNGQESLAKFVNYGSFDTNFIIYDSDGVILTKELLTLDQSSDLKPITSFEKVTILISNSEYNFSKTISMRKCMIYSFVIDANDTFEMYKYNF